MDDSREAKTSNGDTCVVLNINEFKAILDEFKKELRQELRQELDVKFRHLQADFNNLKRKTVNLGDKLAAYDSYPSSAISGLHIPQTRQRLVMDSVSHPEWQPAGPND